MGISIVDVFVKNYFSNSFDGKTKIKTYEHNVWPGVTITITEINYEPATRKTPFGNTGGKGKRLENKDLKKRQRRVIEKYKRKHVQRQKKTYLSW